MGLWGAIGSVASSIIGGYAQRSENKRAYERDVAMWNMQNAYNTPAAQMERLKDAGLNPMLVYGNGSVVGNTTSTVPKYTPVDYSGVGSAVGGFVGASADRALQKKRVEQAERKLGQDLQLGQEQIEQVKNNNLLLHMQAAKVGADALSALYNLQIAKKRGTRDSSLSTLEVGSSYANKVKGLARDVIKGHPSGKNSIWDQIRRFFE